MSLLRMLRRVITRRTRSATRFQGRQQEAVATHGDQRIVKAVVEFVEFANATIVGGPQHALADRFQTPQIAGIALVNDAADGERLKHAAQAVKLDDVLAIQAAHARAAPGNRLDQTFAVEDLNGLAQGGATDAQLRRQFGLDQGLAGAQVAGENCFVQDIDDVLAQRFVLQLAESGERVRHEQIFDIEEASSYTPGVGWLSTIDWRLVGV